MKEKPTFRAFMTTTPPRSLSAEQLRSYCEEQKRIRQQKDLDLIVPLLRDHFIPELQASILKACADDPDITVYTKSWQDTKVSSRVWKSLAKDFVQSYFPNCHIHVAAEWRTVGITVRWGQVSEPDPSTTD